MKNHKKVVALLVLAAMLLVTVLVGCSGDTSEQPGTDAGTDKSADSKPAPEPEPRGKVTVTVYDRGKVPAEAGTQENNAWTKWVNENGPVDVTYVPIPRNESQQKLTTLFASGQAPDLILEYSPVIRNELYLQGQLMPVDDMIEQYSTNYKAFLANHPELKKAATMADGKMYGLGIINRVIPQRAILIRKDWLDKLSLPAPKTVDDLYNTAVAFTNNDPDGNNQKDTYGIALSYRSRDTILQAFGAFTTWYINDQDAIAHNWDRRQEGLAFIKKLYDAGTVDKDFLADKNGAKATQDFVNGKLGIFPLFMNSWQSFSTNEFATLKKNNPNAKLIAIPYPETKFGRFNPTMTNPAQVTAFVNAKAKDPKAVMQYVDFAMSDEFYLNVKYGTEGVHYNMVNGIPTIIDSDKWNKEVSFTNDMLMLLPYDVSSKYLGDTDGFNVEDPIVKEFYEEVYKPALQAYMDTGVPLADITHSEHMPPLPADLVPIDQAQSPVVNQIYDKAVITKDYSAEQAVKDAKAAFESVGGQRIDEFMQNWYKDNKDTALLAKDIYNVIKQQNLLGRLK